MKKVDVEKFHQELAFDKKSNKTRQKQERIKNSYAYLKDVHPNQLQYAYALAQASKICEMDEELRLSPFRGLYSNFLAMTTKEKFMIDNYILLNEYGILEINHESLNELRPIQINFDSIKAEI